MAKKHGISPCTIYHLNQPIGVLFTFTYFVPDTRKSGGAYVEHSGELKKIDPLEGLVLLTDHTTIIINNIIKIESPIFKDYD